MIKKTFMLFMLFMLYIIFLVGTVSAFEFDNVKDYDPIEKEITITNAFGLGSEIAKIKLNTETNQQVIRGEDRLVAEFTIENLANYNAVFNNMEFYNVKKGMFKFDREFNYKYKVIDKILVPDYTISCKERLSVNGSIEKYDCQNIEKGTHQEDKISWIFINDLSPLEKGNITIGIFTDVSPNEVIEWIPTLFGVEIDEWAVWTESLSSGLTHYWNFDELAGINASDKRGEDVGNPLNINLTGATFNTTGQIGGSVYCDGTNDFGLTSGGTLGLPKGTGDWTISLWFNDVNSAASGITWASNTGFDERIINVVVPANNLRVFFGGGDTGNIIASVVQDGTRWYHAVVVRNTSAGTELFVYLNGTQISNVASVGNITAAATKICEDSSGGSDFKGHIDELGIWNRSLSPAEVTEIYNNHTGITYTADENPIITLNTPTNDTNQATSSLVFNCSATDDNSLLNLSLFIDDVINTTIFNTTTPLNLSLETNLTFADGNYNWTCNAFDDADQEGTTSTRFFTIDSTPPSINVTSPRETFDTGIVGQNLTLNWSVVDDNIGSCWFSYNSTNTTVTCGDKNISFIITTQKNLTFYANDTVGTENSNFTSWNFRILEINQTFNNQTTEGSSEIFKVAIQTNGSAVSFANLTYNNTARVGTITNIAGNLYSLSHTLVAPTVNADTNISFFWTIFLADLFQGNATNQSQLVTSLSVDDCSTNTNVIYNFTIVDEELQTEINESDLSTLGKVDLVIRNIQDKSLIQQFNKSYNNTNPFTICLNTDLSSGAEYTIDTLVEYSATGYESEFYNFQNNTLNISYLSQNITLYDLNSSDAQAFRLIVKDSSFLAVKDALVIIKRKYIDEGVFRIVEIPKTDENGETVGHLVVNDVIYNFIIEKFGVTIATFNNVLAVCQTPLVTECTIDFNAFATGITVPDFEETEDFNFTLGFNATSRTISSVYIIPSGESDTVALTVTREDALGTAVCTDTLLSSSGTLSCVVPTNFGNATVIAKLTKNGNLQAQGQIKLDQTASEIYGVVAVTLALFIMLTLMGAGMSNNPVFTIIFLMVGIILLYAMNLVSNQGFIGATILWMIVAIIIVLIKGARRN